MSIFCKNCGNELPDGTKFCDKCGTPVEAAEPAPAPAPKKKKAVRAEAPSTYRSDELRPNGNLIGFSNVCNHPEILAAEKEEKKSNMGCLWTATVLPIVAGLVIGIISKVTEDTPMSIPLVIGGFLSLIMLIVTLIKGAQKPKPMWDGVVIDKSKKSRHDRHADKRHPDDIHYSTEYKIKFRTDSGREETLTSADNPSLYNYLKIGDRVRWHPKLGYCEKYDKSHDRYIYCAVCGERNHIEKDRCQKCGAPLFK